MSAINVELNKLLVPFMGVHRRFKIIYGGRGSSKSQFTAFCMATFCSQGHKIACFREQQNSLEESVKTEIEDEIDRTGLTGFSYTKQRISHKSGGYIIFRGMSRNPSALKSMKGFKYFWLEEAQDVSAESLRVLTPTLRAEDAELWMTANPQSIEDELSQRFIERELPVVKDRIEYDDLYMRVKINYQDNKWFPKELEAERADDYKRLPRALYDHVWLGAYNDSVDNSIIQSEWFDAAIDAHKKLGFSPSGAVVTTHDPANSGDARAVLTRHGIIITDVQETYSLDINESCDWSMDIARKAGASHYVYDAVGCGLGLKAQITKFWENTSTEIYPFMGGGTVEDADEILSETSDGRKVYTRDAYKNIRAQMYFNLAERFKKTYQAVEKGKYIDPQELISISSDIELLPKLKSEVCRIPQVYNTSGQFQVMSKQDMLKKLKIKSPNLADCLMMSMIKVKSPKGKSWSKRIWSDIAIA